MKTGQDDKTKKKLENSGTKRKSNRKRITMKLDEINQKVMAKEGRLKRCLESVKQYRQNRKFQNNEIKLYQQVRGDDTKTNQQPNARETEQF